MADLTDTAFKIDWIIVISHKPLYTLKGGHRPERKARDIYQPLFDQFQVDFVIHGHSHNIQRTHPIKYAGLDNEPSVTESGLDFSKDHGQIYIVNGAGGHHLNDFDEPNNRWTPFTYDKGHGYHILVFDGKNAKIQAKSNEGQILESIKIVK